MKISQFLLFIETREPHNTKEGRNMNVGQTVNNARKEVVDMRNVDYGYKVEEAATDVNDGKYIHNISIDMTLNNGNTDRKNRFSFFHDSVKYCTYPFVSFGSIV